MVHDLADAADPTMASLVGGIVNDAQTLVKQELALAKREVTDEIHKAKQAAVPLGIGIGIAALGSLLVVFMLVYLLYASSSVPLWGCYGIVGVPLLILGGGFLLLGKKRADVVHVMPEHTIATMKDNVEWIKNQS